MARPGITYFEVAQAANQLIEQGRNPTIEQVRLILGTGSSTTIANHLKEWKANHSSPKLIAAKENLPPELIGTLKNLWESLINQSEEKVSGIEINFHECIAELQKELDKYKNNNRRWQRLFNQWMKEREVLIAQKEELHQTVIKLQEENAMLNTHQDRHLVELYEKQERINELHRLLNLAQSNVEEFRTTMKLSLEETLAQNKMLMQEKWLLAEEKTKLQEKLMQMSEQMTA